MQSINDAQVGVSEADPAIDATPEHGRSCAGPDSGPGSHQRDFQFVTPVNLPGGRYAYEVTYDHRTYDAQLNEVRMILAVIGLLARDCIGAGGSGSVRHVSTDAGASFGKTLLPGIGPDT